MSDKIERTILGNRLKTARDYVGLSQEQVAKALGVTRTVVGKIEAGQRKIDALELKKLAKIYGRTVAELTGEVDETSSASEFVDHLARSAEGLSQASKDELLNFAKYLESRSKQGDDG